MEEFIKYLISSKPWQKDLGKVVKNWMGKSFSTEFQPNT